MLTMTKWLWLIILVLGLVPLVIGIMLVTAVPGARNQLETALASPAGTKVEDIDKILVASKTKVVQMFEATEGKCATDPTNAYWEGFWAASNTASGMGMAKLSLGVLRLTRMVGILNIVIGLALVFTGLGVKIIVEAAVKTA
ncbi:MAG: hypothetical protein ABIJ37_07695 [Pseudomonadota bacterium]